MHFTTAIQTLTPRLRMKYNKPIIENVVFKLHYQLTVTMLMVFVILVCGREYFGEHIKCISDQGVDNKAFQTYCFFMATFTIVRHYNETLLQGGFLPHPGVGPVLESDETLHHTYYQWVPFVLFIQAICFYLPHYIWKKKEGGRIKALVDGLQYAGLALQDEQMQVNKTVVPSRADLAKKIELIKRDILLRLRISRTWSTWLVAMEVANLLHLMFQIWLINRFLNGNFMSLGVKVMGYHNWNGINDPLETVFPKVTKCLFHKYGPSGTIQQHDALCVMALNIIHEKIYTILWFWFLILFVASVLAVIWRAISFFIYRRSLRFNQLVFKHASAGMFDPHNVLSVVNGCVYADWLFLYYLSKNMQGFVFQQLFKTIAEELKKRELTIEQEEYEETGAEPILPAQHQYDDETLPLRDVKKSKQLFKTIAEELEKRELPIEQKEYEETGAEPILLAQHQYDDETLPLRDVKKST